MERMVFKYDKLARENKVIVVNCCGFDSIPADLGVLKVEEAIAASTKGTITSIESFLKFKAGPAGYCGHATTFECAVLGFSNQAEFSKWRKATNNNNSNSSSSSNGKKQSVALKPRKGWFQHKEIPGYSYLFPGSDASVVRRSQQYLASTFDKQPVAYGAYFTVSSWISKLKIILGGVFLALFSRFSLGRELLLKVS